MKIFINNLSLYKVFLSLIIINLAVMQNNSSEYTQEIAPTLKTTEPEKNKDDKYSFIINDLEGHLNDDYSSIHANKFVEFLQKDLINAYPIYKQAIINGLKESTEQIQTGTQGQTYDAQEDAWINSTGPFINSGFANYTKNVIDRLKKDLTKEFVPLDHILTAMRDNVYKMPADELKKLQSATELTLLETRLKHYKNAFDDALKAIEKKHQINALSPAAPQTTLPGSPIVTFQGSDAIVRYNNAHKEFIKTLTSDVGDKIESLLDAITRVKHMAKRNADQK